MIFCHLYLLILFLKMSSNGHFHSRICFEDRTVGKKAQLYLCPVLESYMLYNCVMNQGNFLVFTTSLSADILNRKMLR